MTASEAARFYYDLGFNPLPSRTDVKGPACQDYARYRDGERIPEKWLEQWWSPNIQICLGLPWRLMVVDLDGVEAQFRWHTWVKRQGCPRTWTVRTGSGGIHLYFAIDQPVATRKVWGVWDSASRRHVPHKFIEVLGDRSLIVAPPSRHVDSGEPYRFLPGKGPYSIPRPALVPAWILDLETIQSKRPRTNFPQRPILLGIGGLRCDKTFRNRHGLMARIPADLRMEIAISAGLRLAVNKPNASGWMACHSVWREDFRPSASFCPETGVYWEFDIKPLSFLDLLVELGAARDWREALAYLEGFL